MVVFHKWRVYIQKWPLVDLEELTVIFVQRSFLSQKWMIIRLDGPKSKRPKLDDRIIWPWPGIQMNPIFNIDIDISIFQKINWYWYWQYQYIDLYPWPWPIAEGRPFLSDYHPFPGPFTTRAPQFCLRLPRNYRKRPPTLDLLHPYSYCMTHTVWVMQL